MDGMKTLLAESLARNLKALREEDRLAAAWPVVCGRVLAERGTVVDYVDGVVRIEVSDGAWMEQMKSMRSELETELSRIAAVKVSKIHFVRKR